MEDPCGVRTKPPGNAQLSRVMIALSRSAALAASDGVTGLELPNKAGTTDDDSIM